LLEVKFSYFFSNFSFYIATIFIVNEDSQSLVCGWMST